MHSDESSKRARATAFSPSPHKNAKKQNGQATPKGGPGPSHRSWVKPIYPSAQEKRGLPSVVEQFTKLAMEPDLDESAKLDKDDEYFKGEKIVGKLEKVKPMIVKDLETFLVDYLNNRMGYSLERDHTVETLREFLLEKILTNIDEGDVQVFTALANQMSEYASKEIFEELKYQNVAPKDEDQGQIVNEKKRILRFCNPLREMLIRITDNMLAQGVADMPGIARKAGLIATLNASHHRIHNTLAETQRKLELATDQLAKLTSEVTDQDNRDSHRMLVIRGLSEVIPTKKTPGPQVKAQREQEARDYIQNTIGFKGPYTITLPPSKTPGSGIAIATTAFEKDKYKLERLISQSRSSGATNISSKRWTPTDKKFSNLPSAANLASMLKMELKNLFTSHLTRLRASPKPEDNELANTIEGKFSAAICDHDYYPRKVLYGTENSVQYEFLCPVSRGIMMIYKGEDTYEGYDFSLEHPNPKLREMLRANPGLAEKHGFLSTQSPSVPN